MKIELEAWELLVVIGGAVALPSPFKRGKKMEEVKVGSQNIKELVVAANKVSCVLVKLLKDGVQFSDAVGLFEALVKDPVLKAEVDAALKDISQVPTEIKDLDMAEILELVVSQAQMLPALIASFKKEQV